MPSTTIPNPNPASILSEANGQLSRDAVTIVAGAVALAAGMVLGKITASGKYQAYDDANIPAGIGVAAAVLLYATSTSAADQSVAAMTRQGEVVASLLRFAVGTTLTQANSAKTDLATVGIIVRGDWTQTFPIV